MTTGVAETFPDEADLVWRKQILEGRLKDLWNDHIRGKCRLNRAEAGLIARWQSGDVHLVGKALDQAIQILQHHGRWPDDVAEESTAEPSTAITDRQWMTAAALAKWPGKDKGEYGLRPSQWTDYQALVGESGDDVPGCPGWGEKTAAKALAKAGSLADMLGNPWNVPCSKSQQAKLQTWAKSGLMALTLKLVTLARDAPAAMDAMR